MLRDQFGRTFQYLRLSLTEKCNFRCSYCLPDGYRGSQVSRFLSKDEVVKLVTAFADLGVRKIRLSGGEPTLRSDCVEIVSELKDIPGVETVAMTTNAFRLKQLLPHFESAGLDALNVSLDTLNPEKFKTICGLDYCESIKESIDQALVMNFKKIKINAVLLRDLNDDEFGDFVNWTRDREISVRFIELMRTNDNAEYFKKHHLRVEEFAKTLRSKGWVSLNRGIGDGPAIEYANENYRGRIGFISPYSSDFCHSCNRLRVSAKGRLRLCLFGDGDSDLRPLLQDWSQQEVLKDQICNLLRIKSVSHRLHENHSGSMGSLSAIGG